MARGPKLTGPALILAAVLAVGGCSDPDERADAAADELETLLDGTAEALDELEDQGRELVEDELSTESEDEDADRPMPPAGLLENIPEHGLAAAG